MPDSGVLFGLPTESVAVRAVVASIVGMLLVSLLLRALRVARVRSSAALVPVVAIIVVVTVSWDALLLPVLMTSTDAEGALPVLVRDAYVRFAPVGWPLAALWFAVVAARVWRRWLRHRRMRLVATAGGSPRDLRVRRLAAATAARLRVPAPRVVVVDGCPGGALVVGIRQPTIVIDADLLAAVDDAELEGLLAHELAHVRRRDNLIALAVGVVRDVFFFVPGGRWVVRRLCAERELAADTMAVDATGRPGALASGLLKVLDSRQPARACAAFAAPAALVVRVERLVDGPPSGGRTRTAGEGLAVALALTAAVAVAVQVPSVIAGGAGERDALAVLWAWNTPADDAASTRATAFASFGASEPYVPSVSSTAAPVVSDGEEFHPMYLRGAREIGAPPATAERGTQAALREKLEGAIPQRWRATPVVAADDGVGVYWLRRLGD